MENSSRVFQLADRCSHTEVLQKASPFSLHSLHFSQDSLMQDTVAAAILRSLAHTLIILCSPLCKSRLSIVSHSMLASASFQGPLVKHILVVLPLPATTIFVH